jgi:hypothetical protein
MNPWVLLAGAGLGVLKAKEDQENYRRTQAAEATKTRYSPWTGMHGQTLQKPSAMGSILQGAGAGAMMGQAVGGDWGMGGGGAGAAQNNPYSNLGYPNTTSPQMSQNLSDQDSFDLYSSQAPMTYDQYSQQGYSPWLIARR